MHKFQFVFESTSYSSFLRPLKKIRLYPLDPPLPCSIAFDFNMLFPKIRFTHFRIGRQFFGIPLQHNFTGFKHVGAMGN